MAVTDEENVRTPASAFEEADPKAAKAPLLSAEEVIESTREVVDLTVDAEAEIQRSLSIDPTIIERTKPANVEIDPAAWDDLRALPVAPPTNPGKDVKVYVCVQHPSMVVMSPDGETILGRFEGGYFATDDAQAQKVLEHPSQQYVKRLDYRRFQ